MDSLQQVQRLQLTVHPVLTER